MHISPWFILLHTPKTGGKSVQTVLMDVLNQPEEAVSPVSHGTVHDIPFELRHLPRIMGYRNALAHAASLFENWHRRWSPAPGITHFPNWDQPQWADAHHKWASIFTRYPGGPEGFRQAVLRENICTGRGVGNSLQGDMLRILGTLQPEYRADLGMFDSPVGPIHAFMFRKDMFPRTLTTILRHRTQTPIEVIEALEAEMPVNANPADAGYAAYFEDPEVLAKIRHANELLRDLPGNVLALPDPAA